MDIKSTFIRESRVVEETTTLAPSGCNTATTDRNKEDMPIYYIVKVQVKIAFFWITIWEKQCDISDGDTRQYISDQAKSIQTPLAEFDRKMIGFGDYQ